MTDEGRGGLKVALDVDSSASAEVLRYYELWRKIDRVAYDGSYDPAEWVGDRLYFRSDYLEKLRRWPEWADKGAWGAWIIAPTRENYFCVLRSLIHERATQRSEDIEVMFSTIADAGKYVILQIGDSIRSHLRLQTLFIKWDAKGLSSRIRVEPASREAVEFLNKEC